MSTAVLRKRKLVLSDAPKRQKVETPRSESHKTVAVTAFHLPLSIIHTPRPKLGDYDVLVKNRAIGLNPIDWKSKIFKFGIYSFPWINGRESSGTIEAKGAKVTQFELGDRVAVASTSYRDNKTSTFQEYTAIDSRLLWKLPLHVSFELGATLGVGLVTAETILYDSFGIDPDDRNINKKLVVYGGGTVVGLYLAQLAKLHGISVVAIASLTNKKYLESLGVDEVIDRKQDSEAIVKEALKLGPFDYGVDCVSKESAASVVEILSEDSLFAAIVGKPKTSKVDVRDVVIKKYHEDLDFGSKLVKVTNKLLEEKLIEPVRYRKYDGLSEIENALEDLKAGHARAEKFVVTIE